MRIGTVVILLFLTLSLHAKGEGNDIVINEMSPDMLCDGDVDELTDDGMEALAVYAIEATKKTQSPELRLKKLRRTYKLWEISGWTLLSLCAIYTGIMYIDVSYGYYGEGHGKDWSIWKYWWYCTDRQISVQPIVASFLASATCFTVSMIEKKKWKRLKASINATSIAIPASNSGTLGQAPALSLCLTF